MKKRVPRVDCARALRLLFCLSLERTPCTLSLPSQEVITGLLLCVLYVRATLDHDLAYDHKAKISRHISSIFL